MVEVNLHRPNYKKLFISMRYFLIGLKTLDARYGIALDALEYAARIHTGTRKDEFTPEFQHQLEIAHLIRPLLLHLEHPAETLATIFLHDTPEDYPTIKRFELEPRFGKRVTDAVMLLNKYDERGILKPEALYYSAMAACPISSVAKPGDRGHNQSTMDDVFQHAKQYAYVLTTENHILPMMHEARRNFPRQEAVYEMLKFMLRIQCNGERYKLRDLGFNPETGKTAAQEAQAREPEPAGR